MRSGKTHEKTRRPETHSDTPGRGGSYDPRTLYLKRWSMTITTDTSEQGRHLGRLYWGPGPLPTGARISGTVSRPSGTGALVELQRGILVMGSAGTLRSIPLHGRRQEVRV